MTAYIHCHRYLLVNAWKESPEREGERMAKEERLQGRGRKENGKLEEQKKAREKRWIGELVDEEKNVGKEKKKGVRSGTG